MNRRLWGAAGALLLASVCVTSSARAQYRPAPRKESVREPLDDFDEEVNPERFRGGDIRVKTQEQIARGVAALHQEHLEILNKLGELESKLIRLEEKLNHSESSNERNSY